MTSSLLAIKNLSGGYGDLLVIRSVSLSVLSGRAISITGRNGVGKTTLAHKIAETFNYDVFLEQPAENPFLKSFLENI